MGSNEQVKKNLAWIHLVVAEQWPFFYSILKRLEKMNCLVATVTIGVILTWPRNYETPWNFLWTWYMTYPDHLQNFSAIGRLQQIFQTRDILPRECNFHSDLLWVILKVNFKNSYLGTFLSNSRDLFFCFVCLTHVHARPDAAGRITPRSLL